MSNLGFGVKLTSNSNVGVRIVSETADANLSVGVGGVRGLFPINVTPLLGGGGNTVTNLRDISDIISTAVGTGIGTNFLLSYDPNADNFVFVSPDAVVDSAIGSSSGSSGFSTTVVNNLATELDDKIDLDAGSFG